MLLIACANTANLLLCMVPPNTLPYWVTFTMDRRVFVTLCVICLGGRERFADIATSELSIFLAGARHKLQTAPDPSLTI